MVKVAFIGGGNCEYIFLKSEIAKQDFHSLGIHVVKVINALGENNLDSTNIDRLVEQCRLYSPDKVVVVADVENDPCFTVAKERIGSLPDVILLARKAFEAWLLADTEAMKKKFGSKYSYATPENTPHLPWDEIKKIAKLYGMKTPENKLNFTKEMVTRYGFSILKASQHKYCQSAKYFVEKLRSLNS
ncbi:MAG: hypothetical protein U0264_12555 [Candidatus Kapaibacterium sp.]